MAYLHNWNCQIRKNKHFTYSTHSRIPQRFKGEKSEILQNNNKYLARSSKLEMKRILDSKSQNQQYLLANRTYTTSFKASYPRNSPDNSIRRATKSIEKSKKMRFRQKWNPTLQCLTVGLFTRTLRHLTCLRFTRLRGKTRGPWNFTEAISRWSLARALRFQRSGWVRNSGIRR